VSNGLPLDVNDRSDGRTRHDLMVDNKIDEWLSDGFRDDTIYLVEKQIPHTSLNTGQAELYKVNTPRGEPPNYVGDVDILEYRIPDRKIILREYKGDSSVKPEMTDSERRNVSELMEKGHDQISDIIQAIELVEQAHPEIEYEIDHGVEAWADHFPQGEFNIDELDHFAGSHYITEDAYEMAQQDPAVEALDKGLFDDRMLWRGERLEREQS